MKAINIKWDIDEDEPGEDDVFLPNEIEIPAEITVIEDIADYLSDVTGYCHYGFELTD